MNNSFPKMTVEEFDELFDDGDDRYMEYLDLDSIRIEGGERHTVSADISPMAYHNLQREAAQKGNTVSEIAAIALEKHAATQKID
jgi:fructose-1,6-bisphosphatase/sedoheptulose 1,7-bisphosphatase-like protein